MADVDGWIRYFAGYADHYHDEYLGGWDPTVLEADWYDALQFFSAVCFRRGGAMSLPHGFRG